MIHSLAFWMPSGGEWIIIAALALLIFGKRLPEVGRSLGRGIVEFKAGLKGIEEEVTQAEQPKPPPALGTSETARYQPDPQAGNLPPRREDSPPAGEKSA